MASLLSPPIKTLSGSRRSFIAVPSDKNSGFDKTSKVTFLLESTWQGTFLYNYCMFF